MPKAVLREDAVVQGHEEGTPGHQAIQLQRLQQDFNWSQGLLQPQEVSQKVQVYKMWKTSCD